MNQRTCGGTDHLTPTLYNSGLSSDYRAIVRELAVTDRLSKIWLVGYSMGGNLVLKAAGELGGSDPALAGVVAVSPTIDPTRCVAALEQPTKLAVSLALPLRPQSPNETKGQTLSWQMGPGPTADNQDHHPI